MKTRITIAAMLIAGGTIGIFTFAKADSQAKTKQDEMYYWWFDADTGSYLGRRTFRGQQDQCGAPGGYPCAIGYTYPHKQGNPVYARKRKP